MPEDVTPEEIRRKFLELAKSLTERMNPFIYMEAKTLQASGVLYQYTCDAIDEAISRRFCFIVGERYDWTTEMNINYRTVTRLYTMKFREWIRERNGGSLPDWWNHGARHLGARQIALEHAVVMCGTMQNAASSNSKENGGG